MMKSTKIGALSPIPSKELIDTLTKAAQSKYADPIVKVECYKGITRVLKAGPANASNYTSEFIKQSLKTVDKLLSSSSISPQETQMITQICKSLCHLIKKTFTI